MSIIHINGVVSELENSFDAEIDEQINPIIVPSPSDENPQDLGEPTPGSSNEYSRADHKHKLPTASEIGALSSDTNYVSSINGKTGAVTITVPSSASDVGAITAPSSPATGAFLVYNGSTWVAQTLSTWQGGNY